MRRRCTLRFFLCFCDPGIARRGRKYTHWGQFLSGWDCSPYLSFMLWMEKRGIREWLQILHPESSNPFLPFLLLLWNQHFHKGQQSQSPEPLFFFFLKSLFSIQGKEGKMGNAFLSSCCISFQEVSAGEMWKGDIGFSLSQNCSPYLTGDVALALEKELNVIQCHLLPVTFNIFAVLWGRYLIFRSAWELLSSWLALNVKSNYSQS